ncbi:MAG: hypothetical protein Q4C75_02100 [Bergeyella zoohelcum]|nr:hypothetical protein [Bergeyella zoohelcum]
MKRFSIILISFFTILSCKKTDSVESVQESRDTLITNDRDTLATSDSDSIVTTAETDIEKENSPKKSEFQRQVEYEYNKIQAKHSARRKAQSYNGVHWEDFQKFGGPTATGYEKTASKNNIDYISNKYSFVVIYTKTPFGDREVNVTEIFETSPYISEDEKYRLLDEAQSKMYGSINITKRELKSYDSYAQASKAREKLLK